MKLRKAKRFNTIESYASCVCAWSICTCTCTCRCDSGGLPFESISSSKHNISRVDMRDNMEYYSSQNVFYRG